MLGLGPSTQTRGTYKANAAPSAFLGPRPSPRVTEFGWLGLKPGQTHPHVTLVTAPFSGLYSIVWRSGRKSMVRGQLAHTTRRFDGSTGTGISVRGRPIRPWSRSAPQVSRETGPGGGRLIGPAVT